MKSVELKMTVVVGITDEAMVSWSKESAEQALQTILASMMDAARAEIKNTPGSTLSSYIERLD